DQTAQGRQFALAGPLRYKMPLHRVHANDQVPSRNRLGLCGHSRCILSGLSLFVNCTSGHPVMIAVTVVRYATCSYASSMPWIGTTVVASDFESNCPLSSIRTNLGMSRIGLAPPACPAWWVTPPIENRFPGSVMFPRTRLVVTRCPPSAHI